jgi:guanylate kinase
MGPLFIVSGPAGSGKSTLIERVLRQSDVPLRVSVSATTRPPRPYEIDGTHYHFWSRERFVRERDSGAFLEWAEVHGQYYGTPRSEVEPYRMRGMGVVLDIDVQGADQVRRVCPESVTVFLRAASFEEYERRLKGRGEDAASIARRMETARREVARAKDYQYEIVNEDLDVATHELLAIVHRYFPRETHAG